MRAIRADWSLNTYFDIWLYDWIKSTMFWHLTIKNYVAIAPHWMIKKSYYEISKDIQ